MKKFALVFVALLLGTGSVALLLVRGDDLRPAVSNEIGSVDPRLGAAAEQRSLRLDLPIGEHVRARDAAERTPPRALDARPGFTLEVGELSPETLASLAAAALEVSEQQANERAAQQLEHDRATATRRADRAAKELNLSPGETLQLGDLYLSIRQHRRDVLAAMRARRIDHGTMQQTVQDLRTWQTDALVWQFGGELAGRIEALDSREIAGLDLRRADGAANDWATAR